MNKTAVLIFIIITAAYGCSKTAMPASPPPQAQLPQATATPDPFFWEKAADERVFPAFNYGALAVHNSRLFIFGTASEDGKTMNYIFSTGDVASFITVTAKAQDEAPEEFKVLTHDRKLWVIYGPPQEGDEEEKALPRVFSSDRGDNFRRVEVKKGFAVVSGFSAFVFKNRMHIAFGRDSSGLIDDIYSSNNGREWDKLKQGKVTVPPREGAVVAVFKERLWVIGGAGKGGVLNDVWYTEDLKDWKPATVNAAFTPGKDYEAVVHKDRIWLMGGTGDDGKPMDNMWWSMDGANWRLGADKIPVGAYKGIKAAAFKGGIAAAAGFDGREYNKNIWWME
ncbi:MAG TPA: hypothetical protein ENN43_02415 [bacterium]|nr:hypothetical protein [bacterium]